MAIDNNADFTPSIPDSGVVPTKLPYNPTGSFKFWAQKVIPLVYDDSLSYYEVLCKVVNYLNDVIQNVDNLNDSVDSTNNSFAELEGYVNSTKDALINAYNELQDYVNTYFDNLDIQSEINEKLDEMADNGELTALLSPFIPDLVTSWLNSHVSPVGSAVVVDNTLSISGAAADAKATGDNVNALSDANYDETNMGEENPSLFLSTSDEWQTGSILTGESVTSTRRLMGKRKIYLPKGTKIIIRCNKNIKYILFDEHLTKLSELSEWAGDNVQYTATENVYMVIVIKKFNNDEIAASEAGTYAIVFYKNGTRYVENKSHQILSTSDEWEQGTLNTDSLLAATTRIRSKYFTFVRGGSLLIAESGVPQTLSELNFFDIHMFDMDGSAIAEPSEIKPSQTGFKSGQVIYKIPHDCYVKFVIRFNNSAEITPADMNATFTVVRDNDTVNFQELKVLAIGDSICYGARNSLNGFIGETGVQYNNLSVGGATISQYKANNIYAQLANNADFEPDAIIFNGGTNDYGEGVEMGTVPVRIIDPNNDNPEAMNKNTVMGGLQYLLYKLLKTYPNAQKIFVMPFHQWDHDRINSVAGDGGSGGWNFDDFYENVLKVCKLYGVIVADVYTRSPMNTRYSEYRSATNYSSTPTDGTKAWVNYDGVHPLPYGYTNGIVPLVKEALRIITKK